MKEETASVEHECGGTVTVTRSSETGFTDIHLAANGASELFVPAFGYKGNSERSVGDLVEAVDIAQPSVSRHLRLIP